MQVDRRAVMLGSAGFLFSFAIPLEAKPGSPMARAASLNAWLRIAPDNSITVFVGQTEMGQGITTALPMILADELGADWTKVRFELATGAPEFINPVIYAGEQITGGSVSVVAFMSTLRKAGAAAREMLVTAAARRMGVAERDCAVEKSYVTHGPSGRRVSFGDVAAAAAALPVPKDPALKNRDQLTLIGRPLPRLDIPDKVTGRARFGVDVELPGLTYAAIRHAPVFGSEVESFDEALIKARPGVLAVVNLGDAVAVVADSHWRARKAVEALDVKFTVVAQAKINDEDVRGRIRNGLVPSTSAASAKQVGNPVALLKGAKHKVSGTYEVPYLAHATMEPMNCTARVSADKCEIWVPTQAPTLARRAGAEASGLAEDQVSVTMTMAGGGFGRRGGSDFVREAVTIARHVKRPVKLIWSREEDIRRDTFRPAMGAAFTAGLDTQGKICGFRNRIAGPSVWQYSRPALVKNGLDPIAVEGADDIAYDISDRDVSYAIVPTDLPLGFWRSVGYSFNTFFVECFIDELAHAARADPYRFRRGLLSGDPRALAVLDKVTQASSWQNPPPAGRARGIAFFASARWQTRVAQVAEVSIVEGNVRVHRVTCAVDSGLIVNPDGARAQIEGGIIFGLSAALYGEISVQNGAVVQGNFDTYPMMTLADAPEIDVHLIEGADMPGSFGEVAVPPAAPAVANALFALNGARVRRLPLNKNMATAAYGKELRA